MNSQQQPYGFTFSHLQTKVMGLRPIAQSVVLRTWEQEVAGLIPGSAKILSDDWW